MAAGTGSGRWCRKERLFVHVVVVSFLLRNSCDVLGLRALLCPYFAEIRVSVMRGERELSFWKGFTRVGRDGVLVDVPSHRRRGKRFLHNDLAATKRDAHHDHNEAGCCAATTLFYLPSLCRYPT
jgi:hypothetical protein